MTRRQLTAILLMIAIMDAVLVGVIVGTTVSPAAGIAVGFGCVAAMYVVLVLAGRLIGHVGTWATLRRRYPAIEGVVFDRDVKVISMGLGSAWMRLNNCIEAFADEGHLHMRIALPGLGDGLAISIPWEAVTHIREAKMGQACLDVEGKRLWLPRTIVAGEMELRASMAATEDCSDVEREMVV